MLIAPRNTLSHTQIKFYSKYLDNVLWSRHLKFIITSMCGGFLVAQIVKTLPEMQEIQVWSLGQEDPLEKGMRTHSSILAWRIPRTEKPGGLQSAGLHRVRHDWSNLAHNTRKYVYVYAYICKCMCVPYTYTYFICAYIFKNFNPKIVLINLYMLFWEKRKLKRGNFQIFRALIT